VEDLEDDYGFTGIVDPLGIQLIKKRSELKTVIKFSTCLCKCHVIRGNEYGVDNNGSERG